MKKTIKLFSVILALMLLLTGTQASAKTTASDAIKAYEKKISALKKQSGYPDGIYSATVTLSQSKYPVLLVSDSAYKDDDKLVSTHASVYNYVNGKVVYIVHRRFSTTATAPRAEEWTVRRAAATASTSVLLRTE